MTFTPDEALRQQNSIRIAEVMGAGHTYDHRVADGQIKPGESEALKQKIYDTLIDPKTDVIKIKNQNGTVDYKFYNKEKNFMVIIDQNAKDWGTAYTPDSRERAQKVMREPGAAIVQNANTGYLEKLKLGFFSNQTRYQQVMTARQQQTAIQEYERLRSTETHASHAPPEHPHGRVGRVGGVVVAAVTIAAAAGEAAASQGRSSTTIGDYARAAWNQSVAAPVTNNRYAEAAIRVAEMVDPSNGALSGLVRTGVRQAGLDVDPGIFESLSKLPPGAAGQIRKIGEQIGRVTQLQQATLVQSGLADFRDAAGNRIDMAQILRNPQSRETFLQGLEKSYAQTSDNSERDKIRTMLDGAHAFLGDEERRTALAQQSQAILGKIATQSAPAPNPKIRIAEATLPSA